MSEFGGMYQAMFQLYGCGALIFIAILVAVAFCFGYSIR